MPEVCKCRALNPAHHLQYYVYQGDLTRGIEDLRTPLRKILDMDRFIRGTFSGFMMPSFVVDLPGGGGKRLASTYESYDEENGVSYWTAPGLPGKKGRQVYTYYDPYPASLSAEEAKHRHEHTKRMVELETARIQRKIVARRADHEENGVSADAVVQRAFSRPVGSYGSNLPVDYAILRPNEPLCANK
jgi:lysine 2,3-aminomutase